MESSIAIMPIEEVRAVAKYRRFYTPTEVAEHDQPHDCWVSFLGKVYEITALLEANPGKLSQPLIEAAGTDISHWFNAENGELKRHVDQISNVECFYVPGGRTIHVAPSEPRSDWATDYPIPWWKYVFDEAFFFDALR